MFRLHVLGRHRAQIINLRGRNSRRSFSVSRSSQDPLRILFCGADDFSIYSLRAIRALQVQQPASIASIDVVCRPDKRVGRGLKQIQQVPIKSVATELNLPIYQIDTFTGWTSPSPVDLVVAVSFGLLVPSRILKAASHGGLNVHPSLLPEFRGPAPIQHALLQARSHTGVTLQTMHPTRFDHGRILDQTTEIPVPDDSTPADLVKLLGPIGANMLSRGIEHRVWLNHPDQQSADSAKPQPPPSHAPKVLPEDRHLDWQTWTADRIARYDRVLSRLWDRTTYHRCLGSRASQPKRITFEGPWRVIASSGDVIEPHPASHPGDPVLVQVADSKSSVLAFRACDGQLVTPQSATIEGEQKGKGLSTLANVVQAG